jgi:hypothetical protein
VGSTGGIEEERRQASQRQGIHSRCTLPLDSYLTLLLHFSFPFLNFSIFPLPFLFFCHYFMLLRLAFVDS